MRKKQRYGEYYKRVQEEKGHYSSGIINIPGNPIHFTIDDRRSFMDQLNDALGLQNNIDWTLGQNFDIECFENCTVFNLSQKQLEAVSKDSE